MSDKMRKTETEIFLELLEKYNLAREISSLTPRKRAEIFRQLSKTNLHVKDAEFKNKKIRKKKSECHKLKKLHYLFTENISNLEELELAFYATSLKKSIKEVEELIKYKVKNCEESLIITDTKPIKRICLENVALILKESNIRRYKTLARGILEAVGIKIRDDQAIKEKSLAFTQVGHTKLPEKIGLKQKIPKTYNLITYPQVIPTNIKDYYFIEMFLSLPSQIL